MPISHAKAQRRKNCEMRISNCEFIRIANSSDKFAIRNSHFAILAPLRETSFWTAVTFVLEYRTTLLYYPPEPRSAVTPWCLPSEPPVSFTSSTNSHDYSY